MEPAIEVFWGDEPEIRSERDFLARLKADLQSYNISATILANFYTTISLPSRAKQSIEVIGADQRTLAVIYGRCRTVRLLHFAAALPLPSLTLTVILQRHMCSGRR